MRALNCIAKLFIWSFAASILLRLVYGLYFVYAILSFIIAAALGIIGAFVLSPRSLVGFAALPFFHILITSALSFLYDWSGIFRTLSFDSAEFFLSSVGSDKTIVSLFRPILFITPVYFIVFIIISGIISAYHRRRFATKLLEEDDAPLDAEENEYCRRRL